MTKKKLDKLMKVVSDAYDADGVVWQYYKHPNGDFGDTLAKFIAIECVEVSLDEPRPRRCVLHAMSRATDGIVRVRNALYKLMYGGK